VSIIVIRLPEVGVVLAQQRQAGQRAPGVICIYEAVCNLRGVLGVEAVGAAEALHGADVAERCMCVCVYVYMS
jgi:hypothetical protein